MNADLRQLIIDAFRLAERQGKADWHVMNLRVLKNRMLVLTRGTFKESEYGKERFSDLVAEFPDLVSVDRSKVPAMVELIDRGDPTEPRTHPAPRPRIRADLWKAILDFSSNKNYVWDPELGCAREAKPGEIDLSSLPTLTPAELSEWRAQFAGEYLETLSPPDRARLDEWQAKGLRTVDLPARLRGAWNRELTQRVTVRLNEWFLTHESPPSSISTVADKELGSDRGQSDMRALVKSCVEIMTEDELQRLQIPVSVFVRVRQESR